MRKKANIPDRRWDLPVILAADAHTGIGRNRRGRAKYVAEEATQDLTRLWLDSKSGWYTCARSARSAGIFGVHVGGPVTHDRLVLGLARCGGTGRRQRADRIVARFGREAGTPKCLRLDHLGLMGCSSNNA